MKTEKLMNGPNDVERFLAFYLAITPSLEMYNHYLKIPSTSGVFLLTSSLRPQFLGRALAALRSIGMANSPIYKVYK
jgi:hypothetical protein